MNKVTRRILKRLTRGMVLRRKLPAQFGSPQIFVTPESQLKYLMPGVRGLDPVLLSWAKEFVRPGAVVWDIGANVGVFSFAAAGLGAKVIAVEPDPFLANLLMRARALPANSRLQMQILAGAVSDRPGLARLQIASGGRAANSFAEFAGDRNDFSRVVAEVTVPTVTLDEVARDMGTPEFVKLDVEGAEALALQGAEKTLREARPIWIVECGETSAPIVAGIFKRHDYRMYDAEGKRGAEISLPTFNTLAIPN